MAILTRTKLFPQQRLHLEHILSEQSAARTDAQYWTKAFQSSGNLIVKGFALSGVGTSTLTISLANAALLMPADTGSDSSYFVASSSATSETITTSDLPSATRNYIEVELVELDTTPATGTFVDPSANGGAGAEFNQIVNSATDLQINIVTLSGGFSGAVGRIPLGIVDLSAGTIKLIFDERPLFGRLTSDYSWGTKVDPVFSATLTGGSGTYTAGETITFAGAETATVVTGGTTSITFNNLSANTFSTGDTVVGGSSAASRTLNTVQEAFTGVDKNLSTQKDINDALMTEIKAIKGTSFWWQSTPNTLSSSGAVESVLTPVGSASKIEITPDYKICITNEDTTPSSSTNIVYARFIDSQYFLTFRNQFDGHERSIITLDREPDSGSMTIATASGTTGIIAAGQPSASVSSIVSSGTSANYLSSGSFIERRVVVRAAAAGGVANITAGSNTLKRNNEAVTATFSTINGGTDSSIALADGEVLYVTLPTPMANRIYSGVGSGSTNYKVASLTSESASASDAYWLAVRDGNTITFRGIGPMRAGEQAYLISPNASALNPANRESQDSSSISLNEYKKRIEELMGDVLELKNQAHKVSRRQVSAYRNTSTQNIADNTNVTVIFNTEQWDVGSNYNNTTGVWTAPATGYVDVCTSVFLSPSGGAFGLNSLFQLFIYKNSTAVTAPFTYTHATEPDFLLENRRVIQVTAGDTISVVVYQNSGFTQTVRNAIELTYLQIGYIEVNDYWTSIQLLNNSVSPPAIG